MSCKLKLNLPLDKINNINKDLFKKYEISGIINCDQKDNVTGITKNKGDADSVYTPNNVINYHTHPINAYRNAKTAFGSPSGEDYRETIKFALAGNKAHIVFTVEGLYIIQVSPCKIKKMKELLNDTERGILIFLIEEYFKTTHNFRCTDELNKLSSKEIFINPYSFADFANTFDIPNLLTKEEKIYNTPLNIDISQTGHTGINSTNNNKLYSGGLTNHTFSKIPNMGCPEVDGKCIKTTPVKDYITSDDLDNLRKINNYGEEEPINKINIKNLLNKLRLVEKEFDSTPCNIEWNSNPNAWFFVNFFPTVYYLNRRYHDGKKFIVPSLDTKELYLKHEPFIRIFSNNKEGCKIKDIAKKNKFKSHITEFKFNFTSQKSTFGMKKIIYYFINRDISYLTT